MSRDGAAAGKEEDLSPVEADLDNVLEAMRGPDGVEVKDRTWMMRTYAKSFVGKEAAAWMVEKGFAQSIDDAVALGRLLQARGNFAHVTHDHVFKAEKLFYRFTDDQTEDHGRLSDSVQTWAEFLPSSAQTNDDSNVLLPSLPATREDDASNAADPGLQRLLDIGVLPLDEYNVKLLDQVAPPQWVNPDSKEKPRYNLVAIGAGAGGLVTAVGSAGLGAKVALVERHMLGGDCLNFGCVPSKALIRCASAVSEVRNARRFGVFVGSSVAEAKAAASGSDSDSGASTNDAKAAGDVDNTGTNPVTVDFGAVMARMRRIRSEIAENDSAERLAKLNVDVFIGRARFTSKSSIEVTGADGSVHTLKFAKCVIAAGARPAVPPIEGLDTLPYLTNYTVFNLTQLPKRFGIIGSGPIGCELAQAFARFGSEVTVMARGNQILGKEDRDAAAVVQREMEMDGVKFLFGCEFLSCSQSKHGERVIKFKHSGKTARLVFDELLVSTGRKPNVEDLELQAGGVETDRDGVKVNDHLQTTNSNVFAVGDICTPYKFTHMADAMARLVIRNALFFGSARVSRLTVPWATFTSPEVAHVGLYEHDLEERGIKYETFEKKFSANDRAKCDAEPDGCFVKVHVAAGSDQILGATIVNEHAGDMISELSVCMAANFGLSKLASVIHPYPTQGDAIRALGDEYNRTKLTPTVKILFRKLLAARR